MRMRKSTKKTFSWIDEDVKEKKKMRRLFQDKSDGTVIGS